MRRHLIRCSKVANIFGNHALRRFDYAGRPRRLALEALAELDANLLAAVDQHGFRGARARLPPLPACERLIADMRPYIDATPHGLHGLGGQPAVPARW